MSMQVRADERSLAEEVGATIRGLAAEVVGGVRAADVAGHASPQVAEVLHGAGVLDDDVPARVRLACCVVVGEVLGEGAGVLAAALLERHRVLAAPLRGAAAARALTAVGNVPAHRDATGAIHVRAHRVVGATDPGQDRGSVLLGVPGEDADLTALVEVPLTPLATLGRRGAGWARVDAAVVEPVATAPLPSGTALVASRRTAVGIAGAALGAARASVATAHRHADDREAFGRPLSSFQVQRHRLADLDVDLTTLEALLDALADVGQPSAADVGRLHAALAGIAPRVADEVLQLHGGVGYSRELPVQRAWRDARDHRAPAVPARAWLLGDPDRLELEHATAPLLAPHHEELRERVRSTVARVLAPLVAPAEASGQWPRSAFAELGAAGLFAHLHPPDVGGRGPDWLAEAVVVEELARLDSGGMAADLGAHADLACLYVARAGTDEQRRRWLPPMIAGETIGALAVSEPGAGSDVAGIATRARRDGDGWVLDGTKVWITDGSWADLVVVLARVTEEDGGGTTPHAQQTLFVVDGADLARRRLPMVGWRASHTGELVLDGVRIGDDRRLGEVGAGFAHVMRNFAWERVTMSLGALVAARMALTRAAAGLAARGTLGGPEGRPVVDLHARVVAASALTTAALAGTVAVEEGRVVAGWRPSGHEQRLTVAVAGAKLRTQRLAHQAAAVALDVLGPDAALDGHPAERAFRDTRLGPIGGGTDEIMREIVARAGARG